MPITEMFRFQMDILWMNTGKQIFTRECGQAILRISLWNLWFWRPFLLWAAIAFDAAYRQTGMLNQTEVALRQ